MSNNTNLHLRLSRRDKLKRNPLPWIVLLMFSFFLGIKYIFPDYIVWSKYGKEIETLEKQVKIISNKKIKLSKKLNSLENDFKQKADPFLKEEKHVFPEKIDSDKVIRVLEIYALTLRDIGVLEESPFSLNSVNMGSASRVRALVMKTPLTISIQTNKENLIEFIDFLQQRSLSQRMSEARNNGIIPATDYKFLQNELLPLINIDSISISESGGKEGDENPILSVQINSNMFSQT